VHGSASFPAILNTRFSLCLHTVCSICTRFKMFSALPSASYTRLFLQTQICTHTHTPPKRTYPHMHTPSNSCTRSYKHTHTHMHTQTHTQTHTHTHTHTRTHTCMRSCTHIHMHTGGRRQINPSLLAAYGGGQNRMSNGGRKSLLDVMAATLPKWVLSRY